MRGVWGQGEALEAASVMLELGLLLQDEGLLRHCLVIREKALGSHHPDVAQALTGEELPDDAPKWPAVCSLSR